MQVLTSVEFLWHFQLNIFTRRQSNIRDEERLEQCDMPNSWALLRRWRGPQRRHCWFACIETICFALFCTLPRNFGRLLRFLFPTTNIDEIVGECCLQRHRPIMPPTMVESLPTAIDFNQITVCRETLLPLPLHVRPDKSGFRSARGQLFWRRHVAEWSTFVVELLSPRVQYDVSG